MCIQTALQQKIANLTNDGETIAMFLVDTLQSDAFAIKPCHKLDAARMLTKYGCATSDNITPINPLPHQGEGTPIKPLPPQGEGWDGGDEQDEHVEKSPQPKSEPTLYDIVAYPIARYIRDRTNDGETLVEALCDIIHDDGDFDSQDAQGFGSGGARPPAKPHHKLAAASELLRRAFGESTRRRKSSVTPSPLMGEGWGGGENPNQPIIDNANPINGHLAKLVRDKTNNGTEAAELLIRIAEDDRSDGDWTAAHRVAAARELLHRAYDLNYEVVTSEHVQAYKQATDFADEGATLEHARIQAGRNALLREFNEAYESGDEEAAQRAEDKYNAYNRYITEGKTPEDAMAFANCGPNDPDPEDSSPLSCTSMSVTPVHKHTAAAQIPTPKLTVPINNRSP